MIVTMTGVRDLRPVVTAADHGEALRFHRDVDDSLNARRAAPAGSRLTRCAEPGGE